MKIRPQRGGLRESLKETKNIEATYLAITNYINNWFKCELTPQDIKVEYICFDDRIPDECYLISVKNLYKNPEYCAVAWCNEMPS
jgi:hypothetical protein